MIHPALDHIRAKLGQDSAGLECCRKRQIARLQVAVPDLGAGVFERPLEHATVAKRKHAVLEGVEIEGAGLVDGLAADLLIPKWFEKDPRKSTEEDVAALRGSLNAAARAFLAAGDAATPFDAWWSAYGGAPDSPAGALVRGFGLALVERALRESATKEELGGWKVHAANGVVDAVAADEDEAFALIRRFLSYLPSHVDALPPVSPCDGTTGSSTSSATPRGSARPPGRSSTTWTRTRGRSRTGRESARRTCGRRRAPS